MIKWVLINRTYGGFSFSAEFKKAFLARHPDKSDVLEEAEHCASIQARSDDDVVALVREMGLKKSGCTTVTRIGAVPVFEELLSATRIHEYDGLEGIEMHTEKLFAKLLDELMESTEDPVDTQKIRSRYLHLKDIVQRQTQLDHANDMHFCDSAN